MSALWPVRLALVHPRCVHRRAIFGVRRFETTPRRFGWVLRAGPLSVVIGERAR